MVPGPPSTSATRIWSIKRAAAFWVNLRNARLQGADFTGAILERADLRQANLEGAKLEEATLTGANLSGANLRGTNLTQVKLDSSTDFSNLRWNLRNLRIAPDTSLSQESVQAMLIEKGFFDQRLNRSANGFPNLFEAHKDRAVIHDHMSGLMWQTSGSSQEMHHGQTRAYIDSLNQVEFAGFTNWRLPTLEEAMSLMEREQKNGALYIDPVFDRTQEWIWTADKLGASFAWFVHFSSGFCTTRHVTIGYFVRAVR